MGIRPLVILGLFLLVVAPAGSLYADAVLEEGDPVRGAALATSACGVCHDISRTQEIKVGPALWGVVGREVASDERFTNYTRHLKKRGAEGMTWNETTLDAWIADPNMLVPKTTMRGFRGLKKLQDRADVVAFLMMLQDPDPEEAAQEKSEVPQGAELHDQVVPSSEKQSVPEGKAKAAGAGVSEP